MARVWRAYSPKKPPAPNISYILMSAETLLQKLSEIWSLLSDIF
jgi:hypothetical protein